MRATTAKCTFNVVDLEVNRFLTIFLRSSLWFCAQASPHWCYYMVKFIYSEKATKFCKIYIVDLTVTTYGQIWDGDFANLLCPSHKISTLWWRTLRWIDRYSGVGMYFSLESQKFQASFFLKFEWGMKVYVQNGLEPSSSLFCIVTIWSGVPHSTVGIIAQVQWFVY